MSAEPDRPLSRRHRAAARHKPWLCATAAAVHALTTADVAATAMAAPAMSATGHAPPDGIHWLTCAYLTPAAALTVAGSHLADLLGRRLLLTFGLMTYAAAALLMMLAPAWPLLIAAKAGQGAGTAAMIPACLSMALAGGRITAVAAWSAGAGLGGVVAYPATWLLGHVGWRAAYTPSLLIALALLAVVACLPRFRPSQPAPFDGAGTVVLAAGTASTTVGVLAIPAWGWRTSLLVACTGMGLILMSAARSMTTAPPAAGVRHRRELCWAWALHALYGALTLPMILIIPLLLETTPTPAAGALPVLMLTTTAGALGGGAAVRRLGAPIPLISGGILAALACMTPLWPSSPAVMHLSALGGGGLGLGLLSTATLALATTSDVPAWRQGTAIGTAITVRHVGGVLGTAAITAVPGRPLSTGPLTSYTTAAVICLAAAAAIAAVAASYAARTSLPALPRPRPRHASHPRRALEPAYAPYLTAPHDPSDVVIVPRHTLLAAQAVLTQLTGILTGHSATCPCHGPQAVPPRRAHPYPDQLITAASPSRRTPAIVPVTPPTHRQEDR